MLTLARSTPTPRSLVHRPETRPGLQPRRGFDYHHPRMTPPLPYKIAVLCYLFDDRSRVLLLHRRKPPNQDLYSPIGGKLEQAQGESPTACAVREIAEETGLHVRADQLHLTGVVSETAYGGQTHWLMFLYELQGPVRLTRTSFDEGQLEWHAPDAVPALAIPETDRRMIWPLFWRYRGRFFAAHIDCRQATLVCRLEQPAADAGPFPLNSQASVTDEHR